MKRKKRISPISRNKVKTEIARQAWALMSQYIRLRDKGKCFTCGVVRPIEEMQAGHYHHAKVTNAVSYDKRNVNCQCPECNTGGNGRSVEYGERLVELYGQDVLDELALAKHEGSIRPIGWFGDKIKELRAMIERYK
jgi:5-methylcytosine-specific restriction endonuclease McrA